MAYNKIFDTTSYVRKCTLMTAPTENRMTGAPAILGSDVRGSQLNIDLSYLPPGVVLSQIKQGQQWWVEKRTTAWVLYLYVGEFNPYNYTMFNSTKNWTANDSALTYNKVIYDQVTSSVASSMGSIVSDPTTGVISVPIPGLYDVTASVRTKSNGKNNSTSSYYGSFYDTTIQEAAINTATTVNINTTVEANGVSITNSGKTIAFANAGTYNIQFSAQFINTDTGASSSREVSMWLRKNGNTSSYDIPDSNGVFSVINNHGGKDGSYLAGWNYIVTVADGDFIRLMWATTNASISLKTFTPANGPESPAVILTVQEAATLQGNAGQIGLQIAQNNYQNNTSAISYSLTSALGDGTNIVYTSDSILLVNPFSIGQKVTITGFTPNGYNITNTTITAIGGSSGSWTFTVVGTVVGKSSGTGTIIVNPTNIKLNGAWSSPTTGSSSSDAYPIAQISSTLALTESNLSFNINAAWGGSPVDIAISDHSSTYLTVAYRGPVN